MIKIVADYGFMGIAVWFLAQFSQKLLNKAERYLIQEQQELEAEMKVLSAKLDKIIILLARMSGVSGNGNTRPPIVSRSDRGE